MLDAHQHFWHIDRGDYDWMTADLQPLLRDFDPDDLRPLMHHAGITQTLVIQAAETEAETEFLLDIAHRTDFVAGVVGWLDMLDDTFVQRLDHYRSRPGWIGLRPMLQAHDPALIEDTRFRTALTEVARRDVPFDILTLPRHMPALLTTLADVPDLRGIVDHLSKPDMTTPELGDWATHITALAAYPNLMCKISGMVTEAGPNWTPERIRPFLRHTAQAFGPDRLVFGSDWPVCTLVATHGEVVELAHALLSELFNAEELDKIFEKNGRRFYKLE